MRRWTIGLGASLLALSAQAGVLEGTVTDPRGKALANAVVAANAARDVRNEQGEIVRYIARTDRRGRFRLSDLPAGSYGVTATDRRYGPAFIPDVLIDKGSTVTSRRLTMAAAATVVTGEVGDRHGTLPAGSYLLIGRMSQASGDVFFADLSAGRYALALSPGNYVLIARAPGWTSAQHQLALPGGHAPARLVMHRVRGEKPALAAELLAMEARDQEVRQRLAAAPDCAAIMAEMSSVDAQHALRIKAILAGYGWPDVEAVGAQASHAMWILVQHAPPELLKQSLPAMKKAAQDGELPWSSVALSIDRDLVYDGKKQLYGSQLVRNNAGKLAPGPVEDESRLDERRTSVGLEPIADYLRRFDTQ